MITTDTNEIAMPYVCLYASYIDMLRPFTDAQKGRLLSAMLDYLVTGEVPVFKGSERYIWAAFQGQIDRDRDNYDKRVQANRANGAKGGRPSKKPKKPKITDGFSEKPKKTKEKEKEKENDNEKEKEKENEKDNEREIENESISQSAPASQAAAEPLQVMSPSPPTKAFVPPTHKQVEAYCAHKGYHIDTERFVSYYTATGWCIGRSPMQDWKAAVDNWNRKELNDGKTEPEPTWSVGVRL